MSAAEFAEWRVYCLAEGMGPGVDRLHHAQVLASLNNGPVTRKDKQFWAARHFLGPDLWVNQKPAQPTTGVNLAAQVAALNRRIQP